MHLKNWVILVIYKKISKFDKKSIPVIYFAYIKISLRFYFPKQKKLKQIIQRSLQ